MYRTPNVTNDAKLLQLGFVLTQLRYKKAVPRLLQCSFLFRSYVLNKFGSYLLWTSRLQCIPLLAPCIMCEKMVQCVCLTSNAATVFSPEFTGRRAQIIFHDHTPHLECSDYQYQTLVACVPLSTKHFKFTKLYIQSPDSFEVQVVQVAVKNMLVFGQTRAHYRGTKGHSALWKRPSENLVRREWRAMVLHLP